VAGPSEQLPEAAEHARVYPQLRQQLGMLPVVGIDLIGQLLAARCAWSWFPWLSRNWTIWSLLIFMFFPSNADAP
jgi:hypothetical protein